MMVVYSYLIHFSKVSETEINSFAGLEYNEFSKEKLFLPFIGDFMTEVDLNNIIDKSYSVFRKKNVVESYKCW